MNRTEKEIEELRKTVDGILEEGYSLWDKMGLTKIPEDYRYSAVDMAGQVYSGEYLRYFATACQSFFLFRELHNNCADEKVCTLLGDYFFSRFSQNLIPLDNVPIIYAFSEYLERDASGDKKVYLDFIKELPKVMES